MLKSSEQLKCFYQYLAAKGNGAELPLVFWLAVEDMKDCIDDEKSRAAKIRRIKRRFFLNTPAELSKRMVAI